MDIELINMGILYGEIKYVCGKAPMTVVQVIFDLEITKLSSIKSITL